MRKFISKRNFVIALMSVAFCFGIQAQVTIGLDKKPEKGALLDLKEYDSLSDNTTAKKGLNLSRVRLTDLNNLYPMFETTPGSGTANNDYNTPAKKASQDAIHTGLMVYNTHTGKVPDPVSGPDEVSPCIYVWTGTKWVSLCGTACALEVTNVTQVIGAAGGNIPQAITIESKCCTTTGNWTITYTDLDGMLQSGVTSKTPAITATPSGKITINTSDINIKQNTGATPRILIIKITDGCNNTGYATVVQV